MRSYVDRVLSAFEINLVAITVSIATSCILFLPAQFSEIYRTFAQRVAFLTTLPIENWYRWWAEVPEFRITVAVSIYTAIALIFLSTLIWLAWRSNPQQRGDAVNNTGDAVSNAVATTRRLVGLVLAILPILSLSLGLYLASITGGDVEEIKKLLVSIIDFQVQRGELGPLDPITAQQIARLWASQKASFNNTLIALAVVLALAGLLLGVILSAFESSARADAVGRLILGGPVALAASVAFLALCWIFSNESWAAATQISAVPILCIFAALSLVTVNYLTVRSGALGRLVAWCFAIAAIGFSIFELNNNHRVRRVPLDSAQTSPTTPNLSMTPSLSDVFLTWYDQREDRSKFAGRYPVYIVAAQGGGIYAAYQAAAFLSSVQARCPNFAHHLFAISSVSGGSIGAAVFAALMKEAELQGAVKIPDLGCIDAEVMVPKDGTFVDDVDNILKADFWSPLQAKGLFPDMLQRFMPIWIEKFDRARALEHELEASWRAATEGKSNTMAEPFASLWPKGFSQSKFTPALVMNTTEVHTGWRRLIAPFEFKGGPADINFFPIHCASGGSGQGAKTIESIPLSTAAVLSARFPWVTPTGWFHEPKPPEPPEAAPKTRGIEDCTPDKRVVTKLSDGGYFEDSGVATALDLISALKGIAGDKIDIRLIILTSAWSTSERPGGLDEAVDPIRIMLNARGARGFIEVDRADRGGGPERPMKVRVDGLGYPLPLGWSLSDLTRLIILYQVGGISPCDRQRQSKTAAKVDSGSCNIEAIVSQLTYKPATTP